MSLALTFAFVAFFGWGIGILFEAMVGRKFESYSATFWSLILGFFISITYAPFALGNLKNLTPSLLVLILVLFVIGTTGTVIYYEALKKGNPSLVGTIATSFPAVTVILSLLFLRERINLPQAAAIIFILAGIILASFSLRKFSLNDLIKDKGAALALITMVFWGIWLAFIKIPVRQIGWFWPNALSFSTWPLFLLFMKARNIKLHWPTKNIWIPIIISTALVRIAEYSYNFAIGKGLTAVVAPIAGANPILFVPLAFLVFREPVSKRQGLGIALTLVGIVLLSIFSV
jgi:uncharacterized membrane protein